MDLSSTNRLNGIQNQNIAFQGMKAIKNNVGDKTIRVYPPYIKLEKGEELGVEYVSMSCVKEPTLPYNWRITSKPIKLDVDDEFKAGKKTYFDIDLKENWLDDAGEFGYRFVVCDSKTGEVKRAYADSVGTAVKLDDNNSFTVASTRQGTPPSAGTMEHIFTDSWNVINKVANKVVYTNTPTAEEREESIEKFRRNHFNKAGGTINGITEKLDTDLSSARWIMSTPLIGGGKVSPHMYHPANHFQVSAGTGTKDDFLTLQVACFNRGKSYVLDGAFTSQGYEGLQLNHTLKWQDSCFKYWFKNPPADGCKKLGVLSDVDNKYAGIRIVNPKGVEGYEYDKDMPTYIQFYDTRLASKRQLEDYSSVISEYENKNTDDPYEITTWHDGTLCNYFEVSPDAVKGKTYGSLEEWDKSGDLHDLLNPNSQPVSYTRRGEVSGTTGWDGNIDLVKLNLSNHDSSLEMREGNNQAKNYMYNIARFWAEETRNALILDVARAINDRKQMTEEMDGKATKACRKYLDDMESKYGRPKGSLNQIYDRIIKESKKHEFESIKFEKSYDYKINDDARNGNQFIKEEMLNFPLESLAFSPELLAVLSTPFITPRPSADGDPAASKSEIYKDAVNNQRTKLSKTMQEVYTKQIPSLIKNLLFEIQKEQVDDEGRRDTMYPKRLFVMNGDNIGELTPYGKYFLTMAMDDIMTYALTESLFGDDVYPDYEDGNLSFKYINKDYEDKQANRMTLNRLGINAGSQEEEAEAVAKKIKSGLNKILDQVNDLRRSENPEYHDFKEYLTQKYYALDLDDYKMAEALVDQTGAGLNWRFDAAKDVADWDEVREYPNKISSEEAWKDVIDFWQPFVKTAREYNPSAFIVSEVTSLMGDDWGRYTSEKGVEWPAMKPERVFYEEVGATTGSNYSTFFGAYPKLFGKNVEEGAVDGYRSISNFLNKTEGFLRPQDNGHATSEFITMSHVFVDNHDKPRAAHLMAVDAALFWSNFKGNNNQEYKLRAEKALGVPYNDSMSSKAVAVAEKYHEYIEKEARTLGFSDKDIDLLKQGTMRVANGYDYRDITDKTPNYKKADAFGTTPFEITILHVIEQAEKLGLKATESSKRALADAVNQDMVRPYESKMVAMYEIMNGTVGIPTLFAGDEFAQTGCETKSKNWSLGCRNITRHDWLEENKRDDVVAFNRRLKSIGALCKHPGMAPLANGTPIVIPVRKDDSVQNQINQLPEPTVNCATKAEIIKSLRAVGENNFNDLTGSCAFLPCVSNNPSIDTILNDLEAMPEDELKEKLNAQLAKVHPGMANWVRTNIQKNVSGTDKLASELKKYDAEVQNIKNNEPAEVGAVVKYNDKGDSVITVMTNAYMPKDVNEIRPLLTSRRDGVKPPDVTKLVLKDKDGNLIAEPGTRFKRLTYGGIYGYDYGDDGVFTYTKDGTLEPDNGVSPVLDSTATYFCKAGIEYDPNLRRTK